MADKFFGFEPGNGVHDIHMNQSNVGRFAPDNGVYQDGALLLHFAAQQQWVAIFLKFQSQTWHTDDETGMQIGGEGDAPDGRVRIVGALVNSVEDPETESVTLLNTTAAAIDLAGWKLVDRDGHAMALARRDRGGRDAARAARARRDAAQRRRRRQPARGDRPEGRRRRVHRVSRRPNRAEPSSSSGRSGGCTCARRRRRLVSS